MPHPYDASTKYLVQTRLADWLPLCGRTTTAPLEVIDADLATVTAAADRVLRIHEPAPWLLHLELQASRDPDLPSRLFGYNALLERRHGPLVRTMVVLLRQAADAPELTGELRREFPGEPPYLVFRYRVVRLWEMSVESLLTAGLGLVPLAPLGDVAAADLPAVIQRMDERIRQEAPPEEAGILWTAADVLMGLRYPRTLIADLLKGVHGMKESVTYQAIVEEGMIKDRQDVLLQLGRMKFGSPPAAVEMTVRGMVDLDRLVYLTGCVLQASSWQDLLATT